MALKDANLIPFEVKQRQFLKDVFFTLPMGYMRISLFGINAPAAIFQWIFWHLDSFPFKHHSIIKILNFHKRFEAKNEFICQRGIVILPEINMFTFISLLLRIRSRFTCRCRLFGEITNSFISYETFELTMLAHHLFFLYFPVTPYISVWSQRNRSSVIRPDR